MIETFLDNFLIEEIPVDHAINTGIVGKDGELVRTEKAARKPMYGKVLSCAKQFPRNGALIDNPVHIGDVVKTNEFGRNYITFTLEDEKPGATKFYTVRFDDIEGRLAS